MTTVANICYNCGQRVGPDAIKCIKCGSGKIRQVSTASLQPTVAEKTRKQAHEQTYYAIERDHGKDAADKFWNKRKNAY